MKISRMNLSLLLSIWIAVMSTGCGKDFDPATLLTTPRVLAMVMDPVEVNLGEDLTVTRTLFLPEEEAVSKETWSFCPITIGAYASYECLIPECEIELTPAQDGASVTFNTLTESIPCFEALANAGEELGGKNEEPSDPTAQSEEIPKSLEMVVRYQAELESGTTRSAIARVLVHTEEPPELENTNPKFERVEMPLDSEAAIDGATIEHKQGEELSIKVTLDPDFVDDFLNNFDETTSEDPYISFFTTAGTFKSERLVGLEVENTWTPDKEVVVDSAVIWMIARDGRGGQAVAGPFTVNLAP